MKKQLSMSVVVSIVALALVLVAVFIYFQTRAPQGAMATDALMKSGTGTIADIRAQAKAHGMGDQAKAHGY